MKCAGHHRGAAFTLIELLVVISIIAVLVGILMPALGAARSSANDAGCKGNLKQIGNAVEMYINDFRGLMPNSGQNPATGTGDHSTYGFRRYIVMGNNDQGIWVCRAHEFNIAWSSSYGYNWQYLLESGPDYPHSKWNGLSRKGIGATAIRNPSRKMSFIDHAPPPVHLSLWSFVQRPSDPVVTNGLNSTNGMGRADFRHWDRANALFCDGHADAVPAAFALPANESKGWDPRS